MFDPMKSKDIGVEDVIEKFGVGPQHVIDVQALAGDTSDNVPGVPGVGIKTAAQLITQYGNLETLLERASEIKQPKRRDNLINYAEMARLSKTLVTLKRDVDVPQPLSDLILEKPNPTYEEDKHGKNKQTEDGKYFIKDGIHIIIPFITNRWSRIFIFFRPPIFDELIFLSIIS